MINLLKIAQILDKKGQYKASDKLTKSASILLMAIQLKKDLEDGVRALYNYFDDRTLNKLLKETNILDPNGDISARPYDYLDLTQKLTNLEPMSPPDLPTKSGDNNYSNLEEVKQKLLKTVETIDKFQMSIANAHDVQREQLKTIQQSQREIIPDE